MWNANFVQKLKVTRYGKTLLMNYRKLKRSGKHFEHKLVFRDSPSAITFNCHDADHGNQNLGSEFVEGAAPPQIIAEIAVGDT
jgi:hypothetical protein